MRRSPVSSTVAASATGKGDPFGGVDAEPIYALGIRVELSLDALDAAAPGYQAPMAVK